MPRRPTVATARALLVEAARLLDSGKPRLAADTAWRAALTAAHAVGTEDAPELAFLRGALHVAGVPEAFDPRAVEGGIRAARTFVETVCATKDIQPFLDAPRGPGCRPHFKRAALPPGAVEIGRAVAEKHMPVRSRGPYRVQVKAGGRWRDVRAFRLRREALAFARKLAGTAATGVRVSADGRKQ